MAGRVGEPSNCSVEGFAAKYRIAREEIPDEASVTATAAATVGKFMEIPIS